MDPFESMTFEMTEDEMEPVDAQAESKIVLDKEKIKDYLANGGLISILRSNLSGGRGQPRVWLRPDSLGNVTHTFEQERGVRGGEVPPFMAVHDDKVFLPKRGEVLAFLQSFDLDRSEAEKILSAIGTAP